jgi:hypothetical protein
MSFVVNLMRAATRCCSWEIGGWCGSVHSTYFDGIYASENSISSSLDPKDDSLSQWASAPQLCDDGRYGFDSAGEGAKGSA